MCGRFAFVPQYDKLRYQFHLNEIVDSTPRYNIAPASSVLFLCSTDDGQINPFYLHWGLIPFWAKDKKSIGALINARAETIFEKPAFKHVLKSKRGIIVMSGFYEWRVEQGIKQPYYVKQQQDEYLAIAAIWDTCQLDMEVIHSCCLITTSANQLMSPIHQRMPVILSKADQLVWMNNQEYHPEQLSKIMQPYSGNDLMCFPVTRAVNSSKFDSSDSILPIGWV
jgi:putative SOS response-associated peptidase YedK